MSGRRIVVFIDGTSNTPEELEDTKKYTLAQPPPITNVLRLLRGVITDDQHTDKPQVIGYFRGVATEGSVATKTIDGISGRGLERIVLDAYRFISHNLEWIGDSNARLYQDEIFIFGFSRGAFAARALSGFLNKVGLLKKALLLDLPFYFAAYQDLLFKGRDFDPGVKLRLKESVHPEYTSIPVKFLGVWDTVGALGIPVKGLSSFTVEQERFHNTELTKNVTHACQALAVHELRSPFKPIFWTKKAFPSQMLDQVWFSGAHSNVGGGYIGCGLSSYALDWMAYKAEKAGLKLDSPYFTIQLDGRNHQEPIALSRNFRHGEDGFGKSFKTYWTVFERPLSLADIDKYLKSNFPRQPTMDVAVFSSMKAHWSVGDRLQVKQNYSADGRSFARLDESSAKLPLVDRTESLIPT